MKTLMTIAQAFDAAAAGAEIGLDRSWWGFGGVHGGLTLGLLTTALCASAPERALRQVSGHFRRALRQPFVLDVAPHEPGKSVSWLDASALENGRVAMRASALFAAPGARHHAPLAPPMPSVPAPSACPLFTVPDGFAPFSRHVEIRPVGAARPFGGGTEPQLTAWLRLVDDDLPPDAARLAMLMDALAPSYAAVLETPVPIPTLTFTLTPGAGLVAASSPWLLLQARTEVCGSDGWLLERFHAWAPDGAHLGAAEQLRMVMDGQGGA